MQLVLDADPEDLQVWLQEAEEQLQVLDESIIRLEKESDDEELLQEIFRAAHTLKGSSASIKHTRMAELTHAMEGVLDEVRNRRLDVSAAMVAAPAQRTFLPSVRSGGALLFPAFNNGRSGRLYP